MSKSARRYSEFDTSTLENLLIGNNSDPTTLPYQDTSNYIFEYTYDDDNGNPVTTPTLDPKINLTNQPINSLTNPIGETAPFISIALLILWFGNPNSI